MTRSLLALALVVLSLALAPRIALADDALAKQHFKKGIELYDKRQFAEARAEFEEAYKEKPTASIKQNIGLCWKGLGKPALAATAFDDALIDGKATLKPDTRAAIEQELAELDKVIATVNVSAVAGDGKTRVDTAAITVEPVGEPSRTVTAGRPLRLMPGVVVLRAHAAGYPDPPEKKLALVSGSPVDATFVFGTPSGAAGTLTVKASRPDATIKLDGVVEPEHGTWTGSVAPGAHALEVSAEGWKTTTVDVNVPAGASVEYPVKMIAASEAPPEYTAPVIKPPKKRAFYMVLMGAIEGAGYRLSDDLGEATNGARHSFGGLSIAARGGYFFTQMFAADLHLEVGGLEAKYKLKPADAVDSKTDIVHWQLTPELRFSSPGKIRFTGAMGVGVHGMSVKSELARPGSTQKKEGQGLQVSWLTDLGLQADMGPVFLEFLLFMDVHGLGAVRDDDSPEDRFLLASPGVRGGLRIGLGIPF